MSNGILKSKLNRSKDLTTGPLIPKIILFALPLIATGVLQLMFNAADLIVVGRFSPNGETDLGAVGGTAPLINLIVNLFMGLSVGTAVWTARYIGAKDEEKTSQTVHTSIAVALIGGVVCFAIGFTFAREFLSMMGTIDEYIDLSTLYMRIYFIGIPAMLIYNFGAAILRAAGDTFHPLLFLTISGAVNVVLNLVMVLVFRRSVDGVAIASSVSQIISAALVVWYLMKRMDGGCRLYLRKIRIYKDRLMELMRIGVLAGVQGALFSISNIIIQSAVNSFNNAAVVTGSVASGSIEGFIYVAMNSFHHAALSFIGQHIGAGKVEKVKTIAIHCLWMVVAVGVLIGVVVWLFGRPLLRLYVGNDTDEVTETVLNYGMIRMAMISLTYFTCGVQDVFNGILRGMGYSFAPTMICLVGVCGVRILWIYTYFQAHHEFSVLFFSYPLSWVLTSVVQLFCFIFLYRKMMARHRLRQVSADV